jgi:hypothetical protein
MFAMTIKHESKDQNEISGQFNHTLAIFLISILGLFLEMLLIR